MSVCIFLFYNDTKRDNVVSTHQMRADFSYSGPSGILGSDGKQNTA